jgi:hypothetical protein
LCVLVLGLWVALGGDEVAAQGRARFGWLVADKITVVDGGLDVTGDTALSEVTVAGDLTVAGALATTDGVENTGSLPTLVSFPITYSLNYSGAFAVGDGEIWFVHDVLINVTEDYDCTGSDCTVQVGDTTDANGLLDLVDAELQAADTEGTGFAAGWQGQLSGTKGAYLADGNFVYAPDGADQEIDILIGGTDPAGGAATVYILYTRIQ